MNDIIVLTGKVKFRITLDPGVWIFDDRKVDMDAYFSEPAPQPTEAEQEDEEIKSCRHFGTGKFKRARFFRRR
ncbi:hypothetical protein LR69_00450 [Geobacillus sp. BCO2]|nr:hypothetical protein LR69_00450 [Geobacillus sp. BCO2]